jgi:4-carboxymuconolactone decarboxylase
MSRIPLLPPQVLEPDQLCIYKAITQGRRSTGPRDFPLTHPDGSLVGPFNPMLLSPSVGTALQALGEAIRFSSSLPAAIREVAILTVAVQWRARFEWYAHEQAAQRAGVATSALAALQSGGFPDFDDPKQQLAYTATREVLETGCLQQTTYDKLEMSFGCTGIFELLALTGYYLTLAIVLNGFEIGVPDTG